MSQDYNKTVNLPQTDFPMRASLPKREPDMLRDFEEKGIYHKLMKKNEGKPLFILHDGPPYANGNIHIGHSMNKVLKDIIVRHRNMTGYCSPYVPGWDTHGLPIESAILKNKKIKRDELTTSEFREKCKEYALNFVDTQREQFKRLGVWGDFDNPYLTIKPEFEAKQVEVFGKTRPPWLKRKSSIRTTPAPPSLSNLPYTTIRASFRSLPTFQKPISLFGQPLPGPFPAIWQSA